jgi:transcription elongation factor GreA
MATKRSQKSIPATKKPKPQAPRYDPDEIILTLEGQRQAKSDLEQLRAQRKQILERMRVALQFGEATENADLEEAKSEQAALDSRIQELSRILSSARIVNGESAGDGTVYVGATVRVKDTATGEQFDYHIVGAMEANPAEARISHQSPVGQALMGRKPGDKVIVSTPMGRSQLTIVSVK